MAAAVAVTAWNPPSASPPVPVAVGSAGPTVPEVAVPWRPGAPELGIHVYFENNAADTDAVVLAKARRLIDHVIGLEANSIAVSFPFFTDSLEASTVFTDERTPSPRRLGILVSEARRSGLRTTVRPLLDQTNLTALDPERWRGRLAPVDRDAWYASYRAFLTPYLTAAEESGVDTFVLAAELGSLQADPQWGPLADHARALYRRGTLTYTANWDAYPSAVAGVPVDRVDVDAYPLLGLPPDATESEMTAAWRGWLFRTTTWSDVVLSEVGASAERYMQDNPARTHTPGAALDEDIQRRWFAAACRAARDLDVDGLYWWKLDLHVDPARADPDTDQHDSFVGRAAESAIRECFTAWGERS